MAETRHNLLVLWREHLTQQDVSHWTEAGVVGEKEQEQTRENVKFVCQDCHDYRVLGYQFYLMTIIVVYVLLPFGQDVLHSRTEELSPQQPHRSQVHWITNEFS